MNIMIVEDEIKLASVLADYLQSAGYETRLVHDGTEALVQLNDAPPDLLLLDLMLPGTDGMTICREVRRSSQLPIIMLTARVEEIDRLLGLELGADDYICKPFSPREVVARVKAVLRRTQAEHSDAVDESSFRIDESSARAVLSGVECPLTSVELKLLKSLHDQPGRIFNRQQLMSRIYSDNRIVSDRTIDSHVKKLRQKLHSVDESTEYIQSIYGIGYKFEPQSNS